MKKIYYVYVSFYDARPKSETGKRKSTQTTDSDIYVFYKKSDLEKCVLYYTDKNNFDDDHAVKTISYGDSHVSKNFNKNNL